MNRKTILFILLIVAVVFPLLLISVNYTNNAITTGENGRKQRNALQDIIDSVGVKHPIFNESLKGKIVVINVWATWCQPCKREIPELNKLVKDFSSDKVVFLALDQEDSTYENKKIRGTRLRFDYPLLFSQQNLVHAIFSLKLPNENLGIPCNMVINPQGKIEFYYFGFYPEKLQAIRDYLATATKKS